MPITFDHIEIGTKYTRPELAASWGYAGYEAISRGVVTPANTPYIILFITKEKQKFLTQYRDFFEDGILKIEGEANHVADMRIVQADSKGEEIRLFYRDRHHLPFIYHGRIFLKNYQLHSKKPSVFHFAVDRLTIELEDNIETEETTHGIADPLFVPDKEGQRRITEHVYYERSRKNRKRAIQIHGTKCKACGFDFNELYGYAYARNYIEIHHIRSISERNDLAVNPETDLVPLCSNCHSMAHRLRGRVLSLEELQTLIKKNVTDRH